MQANCEIGIDWNKLRRQQAPIIPEQTGEDDTGNFVRLQNEITEKDKENPLTAMMQTKPDPNVVRGYIELKVFIFCSWRRSVFLRNRQKSLIYSIMIICIHILLKRQKRPCK